MDQYEESMHDEHVCEGPHGSKYAGQFKLKCHTDCPGCNRPIMYGQLNDHLRTCHSGK